MKCLLACLSILLMALLLGVGCATSSGGGCQSTAKTPPPGGGYSTPVAVPPSNP